MYELPLMIAVPERTVFFTGFQLTVALYLDYGINNISY